MADLSETIETKAAKVARKKAGDLEMQERPISELIEADRYLASKGGTAGAKRGIQFVKLKPGGTT